MAKPYSYDLRRKVIEAIELDGMKRSYASKTFRGELKRGISRCWSWLKSRIRKQLDCCDTLREAMEHVLRAAS